MYSSLSVPPERLILCCWIETRNLLPTESRKEQRMQKERTKCLMSGSLPPSSSCWNNCFVTYIHFCCSSSFAPNMTEKVPFSPPPSSEGGEKERVVGGGRGSSAIINWGAEMFFPAWAAVPPQYLFPLQFSTLITHLSFPLRCPVRGRKPPAIERDPGLMGCSAPTVSATLHCVGMCCHEYPSLTHLSPIEF